MVASIYRSSGGRRKSAPSSQPVGFRAPARNKRRGALRMDNLSGQEGTSRRGGRRSARGMQMGAIPHVKCMRALFARGDGEFVAWKLDR